MAAAARRQRSPDLASYSWRQFPETGVDWGYTHPDVRIPTMEKTGNVITPNKNYIGCVVCEPHRNRVGLARSTDPGAEYLFYTHGV